VPTFRTREEYEAWKAARPSGSRGPEGPSEPPPPPPPFHVGAVQPGPPPRPYDPRRQTLDTEHLRLLRIGYLITAFFPLLICAVGLFNLALAFRMTSEIHRAAPAESTGPSFTFWAAFMTFFTVLGAALATLKFLTARALKERRSYVLCMSRRRSRASKSPSARSSGSPRSLSSAARR
jgi:hypothetical protein